MTVSVLIVDDEPLARMGIRAILDTDPQIAVAGEAADGEAAVREAGRLRPALVLMDIRMPGMDGIEATRRLSPSAPVLMLTTFDEDEHVYAALRAGASGFLLKSSPPESLLAAVHTVASGDALLAPSVTRRLIAAFAGSAPPAVQPAALAELTPRELEVLGLVARGLSNAEIARELYVSEATVKTHVSRVLLKLGLRDRVGAVVLAYETGLLRPGGA